MENHEEVVSLTAHALWDTEEPGKQAASTLLRVAGHNLDAVSTSEELYLRLIRPGGESLLNDMGGLSHAAEIMCISTVTQAGIAALDLCAAAAYRAFISAEGTGEDGEADLETFRSPELRSQLPDPLQEWFETVREPREWDLLKDLRDKYTHRIARRNATIELPTLRIDVFGKNKDESPQDPPAIRVGQLHLSNGTLIETSDVGPQVHAYVEAQLTAFSAALAGALEEPSS